MNDNFKCIYKILKTLETAMDYPKIDIEEIIAEINAMRKGKETKMAEKIWKEAVSR